MSRTVCRFTVLSTHLMSYISHEHLIQMLHGHPAASSFRF